MAYASVLSHFKYLLTASGLPTKSLYRTAILSGLVSCATVTVANSRPKGGQDSFLHYSLYTYVVYLYSYSLSPSSKVSRLLITAQGLITFNITKRLVYMWRDMWECYSDIRPCGEIRVWFFTKTASLEVDLFI